MLSLSLHHFGGDATDSARLGNPEGILGVVAPLGSLLVPWEEAAAAHRAQPAEHGRGLLGRG